MNIRSAGVYHQVVEPLTELLNSHLLLSNWCETATKPTARIKPGNGGSRSDRPIILRAILTHEGKHAISVARRTGPATVGCRGRFAPIYAPFRGPRKLIALMTLLQSRSGPANKLEKQCVEEITLWPVRHDSPAGTRKVVVRVVENQVTQLP